MTQEEIIKKSLDNLYTLIETYYVRLKQKYLKQKNKIEYQIIEYAHTKVQQQLLDYEISIYKNIKNKLIPFTQIFDLNNNNPYMLNDFETEVLRQYIGLYNEGKKQSIKEISKTFNVSSSKIHNTLKIIIEYLAYSETQEYILKERNKLIKENINNKKLKRKIINLDISFLNITANLQEILRNNNINTIKDIININPETIEKINIEYGYFTSLIIFPKSIVEEIHQLGLKFKYEKYISEIIKEFDAINKPIKEILDIETNSIKIKTFLDIISAQQFEPEILNALELENRLQIDDLINESHLREKYLEILIKMEYTNNKQKHERKIVSNIEELAKRQLPYLSEEEVYMMLQEAETPFKLKQETKDNEKINKRILN